MYNNLLNHKNKVSSHFNIYITSDYDLLDLRKLCSNEVIYIEVTMTGLGVSVREFC